MNATIKVNYQQEQFQRWLGNVLRTSKREASVVAQKQFKGVIAKLGENIVVKRFQRFEIGE